MNKRVWSIAVALAMILSMVCSVFVVSAADDVVRIVFSAESVSVGDALSATVQLNNYASDWNDPSILLEYDPAVLEIESVDTSVFGAEGTYTEEQKGVLKADWTYQSVENRTAFDAMKINFKVIGTEGESTLKGTLQVGEISAETQASFQIAKTIELSQENPLLAAEGDEELTTLALAPSATEIVAGNEFNVGVSLENYTGDWATFTAKLTYDATKVQYLGYEASESGFGVEVDAETGTLTIFCLSESGENITATGTLELLNLKFKALAVRDPALTVAFEENSVAGYDTTGEPAFIDIGTYNTGSVTPDPSITITKKTPYLTMHWENENVTEIKQGEQIKAYVTLNDYYEGWMMMNLSVQYDANKFVLNEVKDLGAFAEGTMEMLPAEQENGTLNVCFFNGNMENALLKADADGNAVYAADILELTFTARANAEGAGEISTSFGEGNYKYDAAEDVEVELTVGTDYTEVADEGGEVTVTVTKLSRPSLSTKLVDSEGNQITSVKQGDSFNLQVYINDFTQRWSMMTLIAQFDNTVFTVDKDFLNSMEANGVFGDYMVPVLSGGTLGVTLLDENGDDVGLTGDVTKGVILTIPMTVNDGVPLTADSFPIEVYFAPEGNMSGGDVVDTLYYDNYDKSTAAKADVTIQGKPTVTIERVGDANAVVKQGEEVEFAVYANNFINAWQIMTLRVTFDSQVFQLVPYELEDGTSVVAKDADPFDDTGDIYQFIPECGSNNSSPLLACWFSDKDLYMKNEDTDADTGLKRQQVMTFKLKAKEGVNLDDDTNQKTFDISVAFEDGGNYQNGAVVGEGAYITDAGTVPVTVEEVELEIFVNIAWGTMEFTYSFGTWNTDTHVWDGRGWDCTKDGGDLITVTNKGQVDITAEFAFAVNTEETTLAGLTHSFKQDGAVIESPLDVTVSNAATVQFELGDLPDGATLNPEEQTALGTITVTIDKADT